MGNCCTSRIDYLQDLEYKQRAELKIIEKDRSGNCVGYSVVGFGLYRPTDQSYNLINFLNSKVRVSGCVLPGFDPRGECEKDCQDSFAVVSKENNIFAVLFDGHGKDGRRVSLFCRDFMLNYFHKNYLSFEEDPQSATEEMVELCDSDLANSGIECNLSGTTTVVLIINKTGIHVSSIGDSRAILATLPKDNSTKESHVQKSKPFKRPVQPIRNINAVALTVDQKPNHEEELKRIINAGGIVEKLADEMGRPIGPYRVWKKKGNLPGLAMSRSIGDRIAHEIGVISTPICHSFKLYPPFDQFIILASDGVWDVMENIEVANFVDKFRNSCQNSGNEYPARTSNSTIARLLCEEARYRWFGIIEAEDVMIDDISCIILEMNSVESIGITDKNNVEERRVNKFKSIVIDGTMKIDKGNAARKDPTRGSMATDESAIKEALEELQNEDKTH